MVLSGITQLTCHPATPTPWVETLRVELALRSGGLNLSYLLSGDLAGLRLPATQAGRRADELWRHTCFEIFSSGTDRPTYREFNFSPSGQWQAYAFRAYREGGLLEPASAPEIVTQTHSGQLMLQVRLPLENLPPGDRLRVGLSAVLEAEDGALSYWALRHVPGKPDFHHPDTFALEIDLRTPQP